MSVYIHLIREPDMRERGIQREGRPHTYSDEVAYVSPSNTHTFYFSLTDRGTVCTATGPSTLHGVPAFALAGSLGVAQSEEQQSR